MLRFDLFPVSKLHCPVGLEEFLSFYICRNFQNVMHVMHRALLNSPRGRRAHYIHVQSFSSAYIFTWAAEEFLAHAAPSRAAPS